jgi:hypothetical protein
MATHDPIVLLIQRALKVSAESHALIEQTDALLGNTANLLAFRLQIMQEIAQSSSRFVRRSAEVAPPPSSVDFLTAGLFA